MRDPRKRSEIVNAFIRASCALFAALTLAPAWAAGLEESINRLQAEWAQIKYRQPADRQEKAFEALSKEAAAVRAENPERAEADIWYAIIVASEAGAKGGLGALSLVKDARAALEQALARNPDALQGSAYTSLGSLYYQVPGWPISFGDKDKARELLNKALAINPNGIDSNFFMGDFLYRTGEYEKARVALEAALQAPARPARQLADEGRRKEIEVLLAKVKEKLR
ncbi:MAG: tetratricopeptide repeat protein [Gammaproteobacteria bacterium]|jgi:tetratricopeptide (TPR) repeat protein|nr:tetratricopeptide repeat protein [Gammaproteobacteria bacterium]MBU0770890.1 tetratricopeptide repeat protein [Gammaproteobacteria bacterium]MBU0856828.1 tetratricopeptide repeat protein [Gammaproteobacteria bacterium]MBU1845490.1 tetratricopeptide repeat protein [Gammaproteobacteria bacterium]